MYKKLVYFGKKYILRQAVRKIFLTCEEKFFLTCDGFFHILSLIKGCEEKKSKNVENRHYPVEKTTIIQEINVVSCSRD